MASPFAHRLRRVRVAVFAACAAFADTAGAGGAAVVERLVGRLEANPADCRSLAAADARRRNVEAVLDDFRDRVPQASGVSFGVLDCASDGFVHGGRIVISARIVRLTPAQRFFVIAHELGHLRLQHHAGVSGFVARIVDALPDEAEVRLRMAAELPALSHHNELAADAYAVALMRAAGVDAVDAARLFDALGPVGDTATHPAPRLRAQAIRAALD